MMKYYWQFRLQEGFAIVTPLFGIFWHEWAKSCTSYTIFRGITILWKRNRSVREGDFLFLKEIRLITDELSIIEQIQSLGKL
jgi:hypothetical protein